MLQCFDSLVALSPKATVWEALMQYEKHPESAILLVNLGSPDAPTAIAVRRYLAEFLWDKRVVDLPRWLWWPILHGIILRVRPSRSAAAYRKVWTEKGSPLIAITKQQAAALTKKFTNDNGLSIHYAMRYGNPSIGSALDEIMVAGHRNLLIFPLYPQYSRVTVASVRDKVDEQLNLRQHNLTVDYVEPYYDEPAYINILANAIRHFQLQYEKPEQLIFSYHGIPKRFVDKGDVYYEHCKQTTLMTAKQLGLADNEYVMTFQSQFGFEKWLTPYTDQTLKELARNGVKIVHILSPAFSADCLETLEELEVENREYFETTGSENNEKVEGRIYRYIPALNDSEQHIKLFETLIRKQLKIDNGRTKYDQYLSS